LIFPIGLHVGSYNQRMRKINWQFHKNENNLIEKQYNSRRTISANMSVSLLTLSSPLVSNGYISKCSGSCLNHLYNFLIFGHSDGQNSATECPNVKKKLTMVV